MRGFNEDSMRGFNERVQRKHSMGGFYSMAANLAFRDKVRRAESDAKYRVTMTELLPSTHLSELRKPMG